MNVNGGDGGWLGVVVALKATINVGNNTGFVRARSVLRGFA